MFSGVYLIRGTIPFAPGWWLMRSRVGDIRLGSIPARLNRMIFGISVLGRRVGIMR